MPAKRTRPKRRRASPGSQGKSKNGPGSAGHSKTAGTSKQQTVHDSPSPERSRVKQKPAIETTPTTAEARSARRRGMGQLKGTTGAFASSALPRSSVFSAVASATNSSPPQSKPLLKPSLSTPSAVEAHSPKAQSTESSSNAEGESASRLRRPTALVLSSSGPDECRAGEATAVVASSSPAVRDEVDKRLMSERPQCEVHNNLADNLSAWFDHTGVQQEDAVDGDRLIDSTVLRSQVATDRMIAHAMKSRGRWIRLAKRVNAQVRLAELEIEEAKLFLQAPTEAGMLSPARPHAARTENGSVDAEKVCASPSERGSEPETAPETEIAEEPSPVARVPAIDTAPANSPSRKNKASSPPRSGTKRQLPNQRHRQKKRHRGRQRGGRNTSTTSRDATPPTTGSATAKATSSPSASSATTARSWQRRIWEDEVCNPAHMLSWPVQLPSMCAAFGILLFLHYFVYSCSEDLLRESV